MKPVLLTGLFCLHVMMAATSQASANTVAEFEYKAKAHNPQVQTAETSPEADKVYAELKVSMERYRLFEIIAISAAVIAMLAVVLYFLTKGHYSASHIISAGEVIFIIFGVVLIVVMADQEAHLTAPMGILGAVAGYLFGKHQKGDQSPSPLSSTTQGITQRKPTDG